MVDPDIISYMEKDRPVWNRKVCEGLAISEMPKVAPELDRVIRCGLDECVEGLKYVDCQRTDPREHLAESVRARNGKHQLEQTRSNLVMHKFRFTFRGKPLHKYLAIPYVDSQGFLVMRDTNYVISPTMDNKFHGVDKGLIFVPFTRLRVKFFREPHHFLSDRRMVTADTYWSRIHTVGKNDAATNRNPQLLNYLMCWMGATQAFKFMDVNAVFGDEDSLNEVDFPRDEWVICRSSGLKPRARMSNYIPPKTMVAIKRSEYSRHTENILASFFYILDNCSDWDFLTPENMDQVQVWRRALCRFIWKNPDPRLSLEELDTHMAGLEEYIDEIIQNKLRAERINVSNIQEFFKYLIDNFSNIVLDNDPAGVLGKQLSIVPQVTFSVVKMINNVMFILKRVPKERLTEKKIIDVFNRNFSAAKFMLLTTPEHPEVQMAESATSCLPKKITSVMVRPSRTSGSQTGQSQDPQNILHHDFIRIHSVRMVTKASFSATGRINPNVMLSPTNEIIEDPRLTPYAEEFKRLR
ncbi:hypothetical protein [Vibrio phage BONAISHI]|nr:hypothetical protein [Vibrio phage BONAISHI]